jgi:hypothetical protein
VLAHQPHIAANSYLTKLVASILGFAAEARIARPAITMVITIVIAIATVVGNGCSGGQRSHQTEQHCSEGTHAQACD